MLALAGEDARIPLSEIKARLNKSPASALAYILPEGRLCGREFRCGNVYGAPGKSLMFNIRKLTGADFGGGPDRGFFGVFDVYVAHCHGDVKAAIGLARKFLGLPDDRRPEPKVGYLSSGVDGGEWTAITPVPSEAWMPNFHRICPEGAVPVCVWPYCDAVGNVLFYVARYEMPDGSKITPTISYGHDDNPRLRWKMRRPDLHILFGLDLLAHQPEAPVMVVEGEKSAVAGRRLFPEFVVVSWVGGAKNARNIDFSPLAGRRVVFLADADQAGEMAMRQAEERSREAGATETKVVILPPEFGAMKSGWDIADELPEGWTMDRFWPIVSF